MDKNVPSRERTNYWNGLRYFVMWLGTFRVNLIDSPIFAELFPSRFFVSGMFYAKEYSLLWQYIVVQPSLGAFCFTACLDLEGCLWYSSFFCSSSMYLPFSYLLFWFHLHLLWVFEAQCEGSVILAELRKKEARCIDGRETGVSHFQSLFEEGLALSVNEMGCNEHELVLQPVLAMAMYCQMNEWLYGMLWSVFVDEKLSVKGFWTEQHMYGHSNL